MRRAVLVTLDGFAADDLWDPRVPLPRLRALAARGVSGRLEVCSPSVTWPNHTTLVTGVVPARHGVLANGRLERGEDGAVAIQASRSRDELCRAPALYDVLQAAGRRTVSLNWPVTRGAAGITLDLPDHPQPIRHASPRMVELLRGWGLEDEDLEKQWRDRGQVARDDLLTRAAVWAVTEEGADLVLLHLLNTDGTQHAHGPRTREAFTALALADRFVGDLEDGLRGTDVALFVVADHGFATVQRHLNPNALFARSGVAAQAIAEGGMALIYTSDPRTRALLEGLEGVEAVLGPAEFEALGIPSREGPDLVALAREGCAFTNDAGGEPVEVLKRSVGTHGYRHTWSAMDALFVAAGPGIPHREGLDVRAVDIAPTLAAWLGVSLEGVDGRVIEELLPAAVGN